MMSKKGRKRSSQRSRARGGFKLFEHPFSQLDRVALKAALLERAEKEGHAFPELINSIAQLIRGKYPLHILAVMAGYGLHAGVSAEGVGERLTSGLEQHHVELLQALILRVPVNEWGHLPATSHDVQEAIDAINALAAAFHHRRFSAAAVERDLEAKTVLALQERLRMHTQVVRNWGYFGQVVQISRELYSPLDQALRGALGFGATDLINTGHHLVKLMEERGSERLRWLSRMFRERTIPRVVRAYYKYHPSVVGTAEEFLASLPKGVTVQQLKFMLLSHADLLLLEIGTVRPEEVADRSSVSVADTNRILASLSLRPGDLSRSDPEHLFMGNPIWAAPLIQMDETFLCPIPQAIFSHIHEIMRNFAERADIKGALEQRRAEFLEEKVKRLLAVALPTAVIRHGTIWKGGETDHVALVDSTLIIVEDKSAALTAPALRGAPDRVRRHVQDLVVAPSQQSHRLEELAQLAAKGDANALDVLTPFQLDFSRVERVVRISVTLDDFSVLSSAEGELREAGWIPADLLLAPTLNVADFEAAIDILDDPAFFLHYFAERGRFQRALHIFADEMDFLGCYIETGFNVGELEKQKVSLALTGMSATVDHYYESQHAGVEVPKPRPKLSTYFASLIHALEERSFPRWTIISTDLLRAASYDEQCKIDKALLKLKANVERNWRDPNHECLLVISPPESRDTAVAFFAYPPELSAKRRELAQHLASVALESSKRDRCILICRNTARWDDPYATVIIAGAGSLAHPAVSS